MDIEQLRAELPSAANIIEELNFFAQDYFSKMPKEFKDGIGQLNVLLMSSLFLYHQQHGPDKTQEAFSLLSQDALAILRHSTPIEKSRDLVSKTLSS